MSQLSRKTEHLVQGQPTRDGAGVNLVRVLTHQWQRRLDPFLMLDEFRSDDPNDYIAGFPEHPHRGFETVTYMLAGQMRHKDNAGHEGVVGPGDVQWMTAGKGILHSETPEQVEGLMHGFQLWINLPAKNKLAKPTYQEVASSQIPVVRSQEGHSIKVIAGQWHDIAGPLQRPDTAPLYLDIQLVNAQPIFVPISASHNALVYVVAGEPEVGGQRVTARRMAVLENNPQADGVLLQGNAGDQLLVLTGQPLTEPIVQWGPFVMNSREEIEQAIADYQTGQF